MIYVSLPISIDFAHSVLICQTSTALWQTKLIEVFMQAEFNFEK